MRTVHQRRKKFSGTTAFNHFGRLVLCSVISKHSTNELKVSNVTNACKPLGTNIIYKDIQCTFHQRFKASRCDNSSKSFGQKVDLQ